MTNPESPDYEALIKNGKELRNFLSGASTIGNLNLWLGQNHPKEKGRYWWRKYLDRIDDLINALRALLKERDEWANRYGMSEHNYLNLLDEKADLQSNLSAVEKERDGALAANEVAYGIAGNLQSKLEHYNNALKESSHALQSLIALKAHKAIRGKDDHYLRNQPAAWKLAANAVARIRALPPTPLQGDKRIDD